MQTTKLQDWGYDFQDLAAGPESQIICDPGEAVINMQGNVVAGPFNRLAHEANMLTIFREQVLHVQQDPDADVHKDAAITFTFPIPVWRFVVYVSSDTHDLERHSEIQCFFEGELIGGDIARTTFGPCPDGPLPDGTRDFTYHLCMRSPYPFPGYVPTPIDVATFIPHGRDVFIGRQFAKLTP